MIEINFSQDVRDCMNVTMSCRCEFHAEATIAAETGGETKESAARGIGFRRTRGQAARGVCSKQFQLTCWNWNRTRTCSPGRLSVRGFHGAEGDEDMSIPSSIRRTSSFFLVKFRHYARKLVTKIEGRSWHKKSTIGEWFCFLTYSAKYFRILKYILSECLTN